MTETDALLADAAERARRYVAGADERPVAPGTGALAGLARFDEELSEAGRDAAETLALLDDAGSPATVSNTGPRYFGFVTGATLPIALAASWLTAAWDQNGALPAMSPVGTRLHEVVSRWLVDVLALPAGTEATFVTGATMANATALAVARDRQLAAVGWDVQRDGLRGSPPLTVVVGAQVHTTVAKALGLVGLGRDAVVRVPADEQGRLRADALPDVDGPVVVCAQAGEVNTGAFDPFVDVVAWARERDAWVHVDGAFGLWARADPGRAALVEGLDGADSWATDCHKWLNVTYDCGVAFVRRPGELRQSFSAVAGYLPGTGDFEAMHHTPQSSQRLRQVEVWAALRTLGRSGVADLVDRCCAHARRLADALGSDPGVEVLNDVVLNQVLLRLGDDEATSAWIGAVQSDGTCWCGPTVWAGRVAMRVSVSAWNTTEADIDRSVEAMRAARP
jgi:glutamate/tyrosine decarboxylase-like PLP-dependent enzyme